MISNAFTFILLQLIPIVVKSSLELLIVLSEHLGHDMESDDSEETLNHGLAFEFVGL
jgi:hypothetical protein